ncbi:MAG: hypothetical protein JO257_18905, partial [Deltaproteobacteria bacterium]|nr:hypothetical protein [Deltaproteobacteria bacterium]
MTWKETARRWAAPAAIVLVAAFVVWAFAATVLAVTRPFGLPLDDSYIYLTYAKQFGRAQPFTYFPGGGYSAGSTSVLWPMLLAPFWTLGARGHALVWVSYGMCSALYASVALGVWRFVRGAAGEAAGLFAAGVVLCIAPFAWCSLSGMEVAFAAALLVAMLLLLPRGFSWRLVAVMAAASLSRPEAMLIVFALCGYFTVAQRNARWLVALVPPALWLAANKIFAGNLMPNTGVAKSHFYLPGFDWTYWSTAVTQQTGRMFRALFWDAKSPLVWPRVMALLVAVGVVRAWLWARREKQLVLGLLVIGAPFAMMIAVIASSGQWDFQKFRYIAPAFPLLAILVGFAVAPVKRVPWPAHAGALGIAWVLLAHSAWAPMRADMLLFAQGAMDTNTQVARIGRYLHERLPEASVMFHDAGAIAYYGDTRVYDMLGLVTNHQADVANNGPGSRFEFLESLPPEQRPTHFAYYPEWMGQADFFGEVLLHTTLLPPIAKERLAGSTDMQILTATWDHAGTGDRPLNDHTGWAIVDRVDVADIASEKAHHYKGALGRRNFRDPTARWSFVERETQNGLVIDGGRTIRGGTERFTIALDPKKPTRIVLRTGGAREPPWQEPITLPVTLELYTGTKKLGALTVAPPAGAFNELTFNLQPY